MSVMARQHKSVIPSVARDLLFCRRTAALSVALLSFATIAIAQERKEVPVAQEPGHHKVFENSYVRVFRVTIPANQSSLLHRHDLDYMYVSLGPADVINAVVGKPEIHPKLVDGQVGYAKGGFAHVATAVGIPFNNVTIELLHPQGEPRNVCAKIVDGPLDDVLCELSKLTSGSQLRSQAKAMQQKGLFETNDVLVTSFSFDSNQSYTEGGSKAPHLLIAGDKSELQVELPGEASKVVHAGEVLWIEAGKRPTILARGENKATKFLLLAFKDADATAKP